MTPPGAGVLVFALLLLLVCLVAFVSRPSTVIHEPFGPESVTPKSNLTELNTAIAAANARVARVSSARVNGAGVVLTPQGR
jgi:Na+-transporting methylmalonyl-CoA/oxaloacetate decarboxylase gamma subunit